MNNEKLERFSKLKQELESMAKSIFESISNMLVEEVVEHNLKLKLDDKIKEKIYKARAKVNKYFKSLKLDADELKAGWQYWSDLCVQNKHEVESKIQWLAGNYDIPLIQTSSFPPNIKDIESTQTKLQSGRELHDFKLKLHDFWQKQLPHWLKTSKFNPYATFEQKQFLLRQFLLALIFDCGCRTRADLLSILKSVRETYSNDRVSPFELSGGLVSVYGKDISKFACLYSYPLENSSYANLIYDEKSYQVKQIYLTPMSFLMLIRLVNEIELETQPEKRQVDQELVQLIDSIINLNREMLDQKILSGLQDVDHEHAVIKIFSKNRYRLFDHLDYVQYFGTKNTLDGFLIALSKGVFNYSALSYSSLKALEGIDKHHSTQTSKKKSINQAVVDNFYYTELKKAKLEQIRNLNTDYHCAADIKKSLVRNLDVNNVSVSEVIAEFSKDLSLLQNSYSSQQYSSSKDIALVSVQIVVITWYLECLKEIKSIDSGKNKKGIKLSSLDTYKSSFIDELFLYVVSNDLDLQAIDEEEFEEIYSHILAVKSIGDRSKKNRKHSQNGREIKHNSYGHAVSNLKKFHNSLIRNFGAPRVNYLDQLQSTDLQVCRTSYVTPVMFNQFKNLIAVQTQLTKDQKNILKVICTLAYRTGLRLNEILGLKLSDLAMINFKYKTIGYDPHYYFINEKHEICKIFIHNNYTRQIKTTNAKRGMCLDQLLTKAELMSVIHLINKKMKVPINQNTLGAKDCLIFSEEGGVISPRSVSRLIKEIFDQLFLNQAHDYSFHSFRHTAATNLSLILKGTDSLIRSWTDYSPEQVHKIKSYLLYSLDHADVRTDVWRKLAHLMGHSSIEMTVNHYLHFGPLLVADAQCIEESKVSAKIVRALLPVKLFSKQLNTSQVTEKITLKSIVEKLNSSSRIIQEMIFPDRFITYVAEQEVIEEDQDIMVRRQLMASFNHILNVLSGKEVDTLISSIGNELAEKLYANRHFQHDETCGPNNALDKLLKYIDKNRTGNLLVENNYKIFNILMRNHFILDYFEYRVHLIDARMEVYIQSKQEHQDFGKFCRELKVIYKQVFHEKIKISKLSWKEIETELKLAKKKKEISLKISNNNCKDNTCQKILSDLFLAVVYRRWKINQTKT